MLGAKDDGEGHAEQDKRDRVLYPNAPAIDPLNRTQQQRFKSQLRLAERFGKHRLGRDVFGARVERIDAIGGQFEALDDGVLDTHQIVKGLVDLGLGRRSRRREDSAGIIAQLDQQIDIRASILGVSQQRDLIALAPGEGPSDFADWRDHIRFVEFAAAALVVLEIDFVILAWLGIGDDLRAKFAPPKAFS